MLITELQRLFRCSQLARFVLVGTVNTCFSYGMYAALIFLGLHYAAANLLTLITSILLSFKTQGNIVFRHSDCRLLGRFVLSWIFIYLGISTLIGQIVATGIDAYRAGILALPFSTVLSYLTQKYFVFRPPERNRSSDHHG